METMTLLFVGFAVILAIAIPTIILSPSLSRWVYIQKYRYETTFALYMLTPTERFVFNSFVFLTLSMVVIAGSLYLPEHVMTISQRAFYYWSGYIQAPASGNPATLSAAGAAAGLSNMANTSQSLLKSLSDRLQASSSQYQSLSSDLAASVKSVSGAAAQSVAAFQENIQAPIAST